MVSFINYKSCKNFLCMLGSYIKRVFLILVNNISNFYFRSFKFRVEFFLLFSIFFLFISISSVFSFEVSSKPVDDGLFILKNLNCSKVSSSYINLSINYYFTEPGDYLIIYDFYNGKIAKFRVFEKEFYNSYNHKLSNFLIPLVYNYSRYNFSISVYKDGELTYKAYFRDFIEVKDVDSVEAILPKYMLIPEIDFNYIEFKSSDLINCSEIYSNVSNNSLVCGINVTFETNLNDGEYNSIIEINGVNLSKFINVRNKVLSLFLNIDDLHRVDSLLPYGIFSILIFKNDSLLIDDDFEFGIPLNIPDESVIMNKNYSNLIVYHLSNENSSYNSVYLLNYGKEDFKNVSYFVGYSESNVSYKVLPIVKGMSVYYLGDFKDTVEIFVNYNRKVLEDDYLDNQLSFSIDLKRIDSYSGDSDYHIFKSLMKKGLLRLNLHKRGNFSLFKMNENFSKDYTDSKDENSVSDSSSGNSYSSSGGSGGSHSSSHSYKLNSQNNSSDLVSVLDKNSSEIPNLNNKKKSNESINRNFSDKILIKSGNQRQFVNSESLKISKNYNNKIKTSNSILKNILDDFLGFLRKNWFFLFVIFLGIILVPFLLAKFKDRIF